ncbi:MAG: toll/interleukin-1 receptor domain-containing protein, partial [Acidimicrobiales bacterium]
MKIFISYAREDHESLQVLREDIESLEHTPWIDTRLYGGQRWWDAILEQIRDCDLFIVGFSPSWLESEPCEKELEYANALCRSVLPVMVAATDINSLPTSLAISHFVDYTQERLDAFRALVRSLGKLSVPAPLPVPLPETPEIPMSPVSEPSHLLYSSASLNRAQQIVLLDQLTSLCAKPKLVAQAKELLYRFREKDYVIGVIRDQIDALLLTLQATTDDARASSLQATVEELVEDGRARDALTPSTEAVEIRRRLASGNPGSHEAALAQSLHSLGRCLAMLGNYSDALPPAREAVDIRRRLAADNPATYEPPLAQSLHNLAVFYNAAGLHTEALIPSAEAVNIRRRLAARDVTTFEPYLAESLHNFADDLDDAGRPSDAIAPAQEAVDIRRRLPDDLPGLAESLHNL